MEDTTLAWTGICQVCGEVITSRGMKYCSPACYHKSPTKGRPPMKPKKACAVCGFPIRGMGKKYCSALCYNRSRAGKERPYMRRRHINNCRRCGSDFEVGGRKGRHLDAIFCSRECHIESQKKDTGYRAWQRLSAEVIARDGHCVICGNGANRLQTHHIIPKDYKKWSEFKGEETAADLITVCPGCHQSAEALTKAGYKNNPAFNPWDLINMVRVKGDIWRDH